MNSDQSGSTRPIMLEKASERCAACNGPIYYPKDDARPYCRRIDMPTAVVRAASDEKDAG